MKKAKKIIWFTTIFCVVLMFVACSQGIPNGTYTMTDSTGGSGVGNTFTINGNKMTIPIYGANMPGVEYSYRIDGNEIQISAQGATLSYSYEKQGDVHIIGGARYSR